MSCVLLLLLLMSVTTLASDSSSSSLKSSSSSTTTKSTSSTPLTRKVYGKRVLYYSPASIGDDVVTSEIDFYTLPYMLLHTEYMKEIVGRFKPTHLIVNNRWSACDDCHSQFLQLLKEYNIGLYITLIAPLDGLTAKQVNSLLKLIVSELNEIVVFKGFYIPQPEKLVSDNDWSYYFNFVNTLPTLFSSKSFSMIVEFPMSRTTYKLLPSVDLTTVRVEHWVLSLYADVPLFLEKTLPAIQKAFPKTTVKFLAMIYSSSFDNFNGTENNTLQDVNVRAAITSVEGYSFFIGYGIFEFSDEWWSSNNCDAGFDIEGCPNYNPYAHTRCGYRVDSSAIVNAEWLGLFTLEYLPFRICLKPKKLALTLEEFWKGNTSSSSTSSICAPYFPVFLSFLSYPISAMVLVLPFIFLAVAVCFIIGCNFKKKPKLQTDIVNELESFTR